MIDSCVGVDIHAGRDLVSDSSRRGVLSAFLSAVKLVAEPVVRGQMGLAFALFGIANTDS